MKIYSFKQNRIVESVKGYISIPSLNVGTTQPSPFYELDEDVYFSFPYPNDKIFRVNKDNGCIGEVISYDFGSHSFFFLEIAAHSSIFEDIIKGSKNYAFPIYRGENKHFLFTFIMYQEMQHLLLYEKKSKHF